MRSYKRRNGRQREGMEDNEKEWKTTNGMEDKKLEWKTINWNR
jgi:hypothetical protein